MSKPTLDGNNSRAIAAGETALTRKTADALIKALIASKRGDREESERYITQALQHNAELDRIADLVQHGRHQEALAVIDQQYLRAKNEPQ